MPYENYSLHGISNPGRKDDPVIQRIVKFDRTPEGKRLMVWQAVVAVIFFALPVVGHKFDYFFMGLFLAFIPTLLIYIGIGQYRAKLGGDAWLLPVQKRGREEKTLFRRDVVKPRLPEDEDYVPTEITVNFAHDRYGKMAKRAKRAKEAKRDSEAAESKDTSKSEGDTSEEDSMVRKWPPELEESAT